MLSIPPDLLSRYDDALAQDGVPPHQQPHYRRWLRFYLDFCAKYDQPPLERGSVRAFLRKLEEKNQAEWMRKQAVDAVRLYFFLGVAGSQPLAEGSDGRPVPDRSPAHGDDARARLGISSRQDGSCAQAPVAPPN